MRSMIIALVCALALLLGSARADWVNVNFTICDGDYSQAFVIATVQAHVWPPAPGVENPFQVKGRALLEADQGAYEIATNGGIQGGNLCLLAQCPIAGAFSLHAEVGVSLGNATHSFELSGRDQASSTLFFCVRVEW
jgi:hypothetical protein